MKKPSLTALAAWLTVVHSLMALAVWLTEGQELFCSLMALAAWLAVRGGRVLAWCSC